MGAYRCKIMSVRETGQNKQKKMFRTDEKWNMKN